MFYGLNLSWLTEDSGETGKAWRKANHTPGRFFYSRVIGSHTNTINEKVEMGRELPCREGHPSPSKWHAELEVSRGDKAIISHYQIPQHTNHHQPDPSGCVPKQALSIIPFSSDTAHYSDYRPRYCSINIISLAEVTGSQLGGNSAIPERNPPSTCLLNGHSISAQGLLPPHAKTESQPWESESLC